MERVGGNKGPGGQKLSRRARSTEHIVTDAQETFVELGRVGAPG